jgi:hypothetical protein
MCLPFASLIRQQAKYIARERQYVVFYPPLSYCRPLRYVWSEPSLIGSLMMISPLRILILYKQEGLVQTHALYSIEAPWLPKSESGTRSPSLHLRHRGNAFSTKSPPSFSLEVICACYFALQARLSEIVSRGGASAAASASPQQVLPIPYV